MQLNQKLVLAFLLSLGTVCAFVGVRGNDARAPWPPPPVVPPAGPANAPLPLGDLQLPPAQPGSADEPSLPPTKTATAPSPPGSVALVNGNSVSPAAQLPKAIEPGAPIALPAAAPVMPTAENSGSLAASSPMPAAHGLAAVKEPALPRIALVPQEPPMPMPPPIPPMPPPLPLFVEPAASQSAAVPPPPSVPMVPSNPLPTPIPAPAANMPIIIHDAAPTNPAAITNNPVAPVAQNAVASTVPAVNTGPALVVPDPEPKRFQLFRPLRRSDPPVPSLPVANSAALTTFSAPTQMSMIERPPLGTDLPLIRQVAVPASQPYARPTPPQAPTPVVILEKLGPTSMKAGELLSFEIVLRNKGPVPAMQVRVEDDIPQGTPLLRGQPLPAVQKGKLIWSLATLPVGAEQRLRVEMKALTTGSCVGETRVSVAAPDPVKQVQAQPDQGLNVYLRGPALAEIGQPVVFDVQIVNAGPHTLHNVVLHVTLPEGLHHVQGRQIEGDVGALTAGAEKTIQVRAHAAQPGRCAVDCVITADDAPQASAQATITLGQPAAPYQSNISQVGMQVNQNAMGLQLQQNPTHRLLLGQPSAVRLEVVNNSPNMMRNVAVTDTLPEDVDFREASDKGMFHWGTRTVQWLIDLAPGQMKVLTMHVQPQKGGQWTHEAQARSGTAAEVRSTALLQAEGFANLSIRISGRDSQLEVGKETVYQIRVMNQGNAPATNVQVLAILSEGLVVGHVQGASPHRAQGKQISFAPLPQLNPHSEAVFHIGVMAQAPGDRRVRVQVTSDQAPTPVTREERTLVYRD